MGTYNVHWRVWWNVAHAAKDQGHANLPDQAHSGKHARKTPDEERSSKSSKPHKLEILVGGISGEQMLGADSTPDDTGVVECLDVRARK